MTSKLSLSFHNTLSNLKWIWSNIDIFRANSPCTIPIMTYTQYFKENVCFTLIFLNIYIYNTSKTVLDIQIWNWVVPSGYDNNVFQMLKSKSFFFSFRIRKSRKDDKDNLEFKNQWWWVDIKINLIPGELVYI